MAHFMVGCRGSRGTVTRLGGKAGCPESFASGQTAGVRVVAVCDDAGDGFEVYATQGSFGAGSSVFLGTVRKDDAGRLHLVLGDKADVRRPDGAAIVG